MKALCCLLLYLLAGAAQAQQPATIDHVALLVQNLDSSAVFYTRLFGLPELPNPFPKERVKWYRLGSQVQLHLIVGLPAPVTQSRLVYLCLSVPSMEGFVLKLKQAHLAFCDAHDVAVAISVRGDGVHQVFLRDPSGYWVEANDAAHR